MHRQRTPRRSKSQIAMCIMCFLNTEAHPAGKTNLVIPPRRLKHTCGRRSRRLPSGSAVRCCDGGVTPATALGRPRRRGSSLNGTRCAHFRAKQPLQSEVPGAPRSAESEVKPEGHRSHLGPTWGAPAFQTRVPRGLGTGGPFLLSGQAPCLS